MCARPRSFTNDELLETMRNHPRPFCTAQELADRFGVENKTILNRLKELEEKNEVESKRVGARARVFWLAGYDCATNSRPSSVSQ